MKINLKLKDENLPKLYQKYRSAKYLYKKKKSKKTQENINKILLEKGMKIRNKFKVE